ncbi:ABC transporter permease [Thermogladius sp. 4427co]|uniref:ABC transporter permease n=1 Tax=Thermogladius sp. 4427co TaxID=3450718 RepID=UPI003F7A9B5F
MNPVIYDFKRGLLRLSTIVALIIFILAGIGLAYLITNTLAVSPLRSSIVYSYIDPSNKTFVLEALFVSPELKLIQGSLSYTLAYNSTGSNRVVLDSGEARGFGKVFVYKRLDNLPVEQPLVRFYLELDTATTLGSFEAILFYETHNIGGKTIYFLHLSPLPSVSTLFTCYRFSNDIIDLGSLANSSTQIPLSKFYAGALLAEKIGSDKYRIISISFVYDEDNLTYQLFIPKPNITEIPSNLSLSNIEEYFTRIATVKPGLSYSETVYEGKLPTYEEIFAPPGGPASTVPPLLVSTSGRGLVACPIPLSIFPYEPPSTKRIIASAMSSGAGLGLLSTFFPIIMLYLAYVYIAKPRSLGALEFLAARPVTRLDIYLTRYLAGSLVAIASTFLFFITMLTALNYLVGPYLDLYSYMILFAGTALSLLAYYSLFYFIATTVKGSRYLAISIFVYIFYAFLYNILVMFITFYQGLSPDFTSRLVRNQYISYYFSPSGPSAFLQYFFLVHNNATTGLEAASEVVNPWLVSLATISWITVPFILGWLVFRKANLAG